MSDAVTLELTEVTRLGDDIKVVGRPVYVHAQED